MDIIRRGLYMPLTKLVNISSLNESLWVTQSRTFAARKGTRAKADKKKKAQKVAEVKAEFIPHVLREKAVSKIATTRRLDDSHLNLPQDDVWISKYYRWKVYDFKEAVECHRETHHPQIYNQPDAFLRVFIELDMRTAKKTKFVESFSRISKVDHPFDHGEKRSILVFCKTPEMREDAESAGATLVGGVDLLRKIEKGDIVLPDIDYVLAHPDILPELVVLRGLLKKKFPNPKNGNLGVDIGNMVKRFQHGIQYSALKDENEQDYGWVDTHIGTLDMEPKHLESNFQNLVEDINTMRPPREGLFITRVFLTSPPSVERFKLNIQPYLPDEFKKDDYESDSDDEKSKATAT